MFKVETFANSKAFYRDLVPEQHAIHLVPVHALTKPIEDRLNGLQITNSKTLAYLDLIQRLFPAWNQPLTDLYLRSRIREILRNITSGILL